MANWLTYREPEMQNLFLEGVDVKLLVRREDQNHPTISGNKWWKLKYNLIHAIEEQYNSVLTFGGAYSNHIYATAAACAALDLKSIGIIRGERIEPLNDTLAFAEQKGMQLRFISREQYRKKNEESFRQALQKELGNCFIIPEGGTNALAVKACEELGQKLLQHDFDYLCLPVGTGGTMAGIVEAFGEKRKVIGIPVLKDSSFLKDEIQQLLSGSFNNWELVPDYHFGGYAKSNLVLHNFINELKTKVPLEFVYSGKLFFGVLDLVKKGFFKKGSTVMILHTGGLKPNVD